MLRLEHLKNLWVLIRFAFARNPDLFAALAISVLSVLCELAAMSVLFPLAAATAGQSGTDPVSRWLSTHLGWSLSSLQLLLVFAGLFSARLLAQLISQLMISAVSKRMLSQLATDGFHNLLTAIEIRDIEQKTIGSYITLVGDESFRASTIVSSLAQLLSSGLLGALYFVTIAAFSPITSILLILFLLTAAASMLYPFRLSHRLGYQMTEQGRVASSIFLDALNGLRSVRAFSAEDFVSEEYRLAMRSYTSTMSKIDSLSLLTRLVPALLIFLLCAIATTIPNTDKYLADNFPFVIALSLLLLRFFPTVGQTVNTALRIASDARAGRDATQLASKSRPSKDPVARPRNTQVRKIDFKDVTFFHTESRPLFNAATFSFERSRSYALVGESGSGKSTLFDLLLKFFVPASGQILVDGTDTRTAPQGEVRNKILLVTQDVTIFNDTVRNNLRFGMEIEDSVLWRALETVHAIGFVRDLPRGLDTKLQYRGTNLSGGQRQRLGLARAVARRPDVLLLDESTSALDAQTRTSVVQALIEEFRDRIIVFITHDEAVMSAVDEVIRVSDVAGVSRNESP